MNVFHILFVGFCFIILHHHNIQRHRNSSMFNSHTLHSIPLFSVMATTILTFPLVSVILLSPVAVSLSVAAHLAICCPLILPLISGSAIQRSDPGLGVQDERGRRAFVLPGSKERIGALEEEVFGGSREQCSAALERGRGLGNLPKKFDYLLVWPTDTCSRSSSRLSLLLSPPICPRWLRRNRYTVPIIIAI